MAGRKVVRGLVIPLVASLSLGSLGLEAGENRLKFLCQGSQGLAARARIAVISYGEPLSP